MTVKILGRLSSINVRKVLWACDELGLAYIREDWGTGFADVQDPAFLALNPNAQIPVIIDGDVVLWESNTILRYLANAHGGEAFYPNAPVARARVDQWLDWQASDLNPAWSYAFLALARGSEAHRIPLMIDRSIARWTQLMQVLDGHLATRAHMAGEAFSLADIAVGLSVTRWLATPFSKPDLPAVAAYHARLSQRPAFAAYGLAGIA
ncbi:MULTISPECIES: glutathione S-transferase family protein [Asticcacaulis]|uniref:glutathione S-transferase family protein n=1 Tax=Asticcacaulis TaxID=76890 RepID=UPI001AEB90DB|nr:MULTISPECIES: glutathione S-transferase [Asticcacaulis]MBP2160413.1 glutathione S-transferase [Asticcacaulis solisilvae]MDR6801284.1 glutathione S-transferase [Asticcacaulis sp. BE141]